jgi:hypothetical protein
MNKALKIILSSIPFWTAGAFLFYTLPDKLTQLLPLKIIGKLTVGLFLLILLLSTYVYILKRRLSKEVDIDDYKIHHPVIGVTFYKLKNDQDPSPAKRWFCAHCMDKKRYPSTVQPNFKQNGKYTWKCPECKTEIQT